MIIVHSDGCGFTNLMNITELSVMGKYIQATRIDGKCHPVARYDTEERAESIFKYIVDCYRCMKDHDAIKLPSE